MGAVECRYIGSLSGEVGDVWEELMKRMIVVLFEGSEMERTGFWNIWNGGKGI